MVVRREGLYDITVGDTVEFVLGAYNINKFRKLQYSGWIDGKYYFLPPHQELVNALMKLEKDSLVKATRLTQGGEDEKGNFHTAEYKIEILREGPE